MTSAITKYLLLIDGYNSEVIVRAKMITDVHVIALETKDYQLSGLIPRLSEVDPVQFKDF